MYITLIKLAPVIDNVALETGVPSELASISPPEIVIVSDVGVPSALASISPPIIPILSAIADPQSVHNSFHSGEPELAKYASAISRSVLNLIIPTCGTLGL